MHVDAAVLTRSAVHPSSSCTSAARGTARMRGVGAAIAAPRTRLTRVQPFRCIVCGEVGRGRTRESKRHTRPQPHIVTRIHTSAALLPSSQYGTTLRAPHTVYDHQHGKTTSTNRPSTHTVDPQRSLAHTRPGSGSTSVVEWASSQHLLPHLDGPPAILALAIERPVALVTDARSVRIDVRKRVELPVLGDDRGVREAGDVTPAGAGRNAQLPFARRTPARRRAAARAREHQSAIMRLFARRLRIRRAPLRCSTRPWRRRAANYL